DRPAGGGRSDGSAAGGPGESQVGRVPPDDALARLTRGLPRELAEIIAHRVVGDLSIAEIAELLGKRPGAVRVAQHRALRRLASTLTPDQVRQAFDA
ncbi:MAG: RNA polymerase sigma factor, partial [Acidimicrobiales bacterium]